MPKQLSSIAVFVLGFTVSKLNSIFDKSSEPDLATELIVKPTTNTDVKINIDNKTETVFLNKGFWEILFIL